MTTSESLRRPLETPPQQAGLDPAAICTLPAEGLSERLAWIRREILPYARQSRAVERGIRVELDPVPGLAVKLDRLIELERECCSGLELERREEPGSARTILEIRGVDPEASIFAALGEAAAPSSTGARLAKSIGVGVLASLFACCVLPLALLTLLGAVALPLAALDAPVAIVVGALLGALSAWWWLGRRRARGAASEAACGPGC